MTATKPDPKRLGNGTTGGAFIPHSNSLAQTVRDAHWMIDLLVKSCDEDKPLKLSITRMTELRHKLTAALPRAEGADELAAAVETFFAAVDELPYRLFRKDLALRAALRRYRGQS